MSKPISPESKPISPEVVPNLIGAIFNGRYDHHLDAISQAVYDRKRTLGEQKAAENLAHLKPGDVVRVTGAIKPKYLKDQLGKVIDRTNAQTWFDRPKREGFIDIDLGRKVRQYGPCISVPAQLISLVARKEDADGVAGPLS